MARPHEQPTIATPGCRAQIARTHRRAWGLALALLCTASTVAWAAPDTTEVSSPATDIIEDAPTSTVPEPIAEELLLPPPAPLEEASPSAAELPELESMDAAAAVGAIPAAAEDGVVTNELEAEKKEEVVREQQDALEERRDDLEAIEEKAPETLTASELPKPCTGPWDWVHLSSGEWLRGEFKRMRKKQFEFRSTRMKKQSIEWKHIKEFCFANETRFILYDHTVLSGRGKLVGGRLTVVDVDVTQTAPRADIWAILPGLPTELNRWRATLSAGLDAYSGNTDQQNLTASVSVDREDPSTHLDLDYTTSFGRSDGVENVKRHRATAQLDVYFNRSFFAALPAVVYTSDTFQNLQQRITPGLSLGYEIFDLDDFEWDVQAGLGYQYTQYVSVQPGQSLRDNDVGPVVTTSLVWDITGDLTFKVSQSAVLLTIDFDQSNFHTQGSLVYDVTDLIYLEFSVWYDRVLRPRETSDGSVPDANDTRTVVSIGLNFD